MLKALRKNTKIIIWAVVATFVLWGGFSVGSSFQKEGRVAGEIFGRDISFQEFNTIQRATHVFAFAKRSQTDPDRLRAEAWQNLILVHEAKNRNIEVSDEEVRDEVMRILKQHDLENPSMEVYGNWVKTVSGQTPQEFEKQLREMMRIQKLLKTVEPAAIAAPTDEEVRKRFYRENHKIKAEILFFPTEEEAAAFYEKPLTARNWKKEAAPFTEDPDRYQATDLLNLDTWIYQFGLSEAEAFDLHAQEAESVSKPMAVGARFALFYVQDKKNADDAQLQDPEVMENYRTALSQADRNRQFTQWYLDVLRRAELKDYLPSATGE